MARWNSKVRCGGLPRSGLVQQDNILPLEFSQLNTAIQDAGSFILQCFGKELKLNHKSTSADYCTMVDIKVEQAIIAAIDKLFPNYNIIAEESGNIDRKSEYTFIIDPLDGTNNFVLGVPIFSSSVALMQDQEIIYGVVYCPITGDLYYALKGQGAFLNGKPISVNNEHHEQNATISYYCNYITPKERILKFRKKLLDIPVRRCLDFWAPAICYCKLASGKIEAIINDKIELYDFAAGKLIALEAGAKITDFSGAEIKNDTDDLFIISNGTSLHSFFVKNITASL